MQYVILAGGKASRFNGLPKECLPANKEDTFLDLHIKRCLENYDPKYEPPIRIVTNEWKMRQHAKICEKYPAGTINFVVQYAGELMDAVKIGQSLREDNVFFLADSYFESGQFSLLSDFYEYELIFGTFHTEEGMRFSLLNNGRINTKSLERGLAWGCFSYRSRCAEFVASLDTSKLTYDQVLSMCMTKFSWTNLTIDNYWDIGNFEYYKDFLNKNG
jgi:hypothetical protein